MTMTSISARAGRSFNPSCSSSAVNSDTDSPGVADGAGVSNLYWQRADGSGEPRAVLATPAAELCSGVSPDGRWMLVTSDQSGREELGVVPVAGNAPVRVRA